MREGIMSLRDRKKEYALSENTILFVVAVVIFMITVILDMSLIDNDSRLTQLLRYSGYGLACFKLIRGAYDRENLIKYLIGLVILALGFVVNRNQIMILYSLIILASIDVEDEIIMKVYLAVHFVMTFGIVMLSQMGVILDYVHKFGDKYRHFLGFDYTTMAPIFMIFIITEYIYHRKGKIKLWEYLLGVAISFLFFKWTNTNYTFLLSLGILTFFLINGMWIDKGYITNTFRRLLCVSPWIIAGVSIWAQWAYNSDNAIWSKINDLIHNRLSLGHDAIQKYGFKLFGNRIEWVTNSYHNHCSPKGYNYVDSAYLQLILEQGIVCFILVMLIYSMIIHILIKKQKFYAAWLVVFVLIFNMTEPKLVHPVYNPFIMLAFAFLIQEISTKIKNGRKIINIRK